MSFIEAMILAATILKPPAANILALVELTIFRNELRVIYKYSPMKSYTLKWLRCNRKNSTQLVCLDGWSLLCC